ncbi:hypothetical protein B484DRAFT_129241 [Ochromonadaceae sp. CCMP2298]|nr:hypothetical protein B484DRAFT_129241 [Ochromonadaceae sp. CCMP2298]
MRNQSICDKCYPAHSRTSAHPHQRYHLYIRVSVPTFFELTFSTFLPVTFYTLFCYHCYPYLLLFTTYLFCFTLSLLPVSFFVLPTICLPPFFYLLASHFTSVCSTHTGTRVCVAILFVALLAIFFLALFLEVLYRHLANKFHLANDLMFLFTVSL